MRYIAHRRFQRRALCGDVNIPAMTECELADGVIRVDGREICAATSENAHRFFARNDDGRGMERGGLTRAIVAKLEKRDKRYQERWDRVWADALCRKYRREEHADYWLWDHTFYNAPVEDLRYIARLVGAKGG